MGLRGPDLGLGLDNTIGAYKYCVLFRNELDMWFLKRGPTFFSRHIGICKMGFLSLEWLKVRKRTNVKIPFNMLLGVSKRLTGARHRVTHYIQLDK